MRSTALVLLLLVAIVVVSIVALDANEHSNDIWTNRVRPHFRLPKLFQFTIYKKLYSKTYSNLAEEARRAKLFFARAFKVFISAVKYRHKRDSKYLAINPMSDWTPKERLALSNTANLIQTNDQSKSDEDSNEIPAADFEDVKEKLADILEHRADSQELNEVAKELEQASSRTRRDISSTERQLSTDDLMPDPAKSPINLVQSDDLTMRPMTDAEVAQLNKQSGGNFLTRWFRLFLDFWHAINRDVAVPNLPDKVFLDLRDSNCITRVKAQGRCGSCYAFGVIQLYEYHYCKETNELVDISAQYVVDCAKDSPNSGGCVGGYGSITADFVDKKGLELATHYPYDGKAYTCPYENEDETNRMGFVKVNNAKLISLRNLDRDTLAETLRRFGPIYVSIKINDDFVDYGGGIDRLERCSFKAGHALTIIGHGREDGLEYWLVKNSFGTIWGHAGYWKLSKGVPFRCLVGAAYVQPKFEKNPDHDLDFLRQRIRARRLQ